MKLYTEEQVRVMLEICRDTDLYEHILTFDDILKTQTPIENTRRQTMKQQHKAIELVQEYFLLTGDIKLAMQCAYKAIDEVKKTLFPWQKETLDYWSLVQLEIMAYEHGD